MENTSRVVARRRYLTLAVAGIIMVLGQGIWVFHDSLLLAAVVLAAGLVWTTPGWKAWTAALLTASVGLLWSTFDPLECSVGWRGRVVYEKLVGHLPYVAWSEVGRRTFSSCSSFYRVEAKVKEEVRLVSDKTVDGKKWELYETRLGPFWIAAPGKELLTWLVWEITMQHDYESGQVAIRPGDTVIDGGAHVGVFTRHALERGAARVVVIEPEPTNIACLEANLAGEIADGRVQLVKAGIWDKKDFLTLSDSKENSAGHSFVREVPDSSKISGMPVVTLDEIVEQLQLDRVDFIKMDIEGAERRALEGARQTIGRFKPRMAICTYHLRGDTEAVPAAVKKVQPAYQIFAKDFEQGGWRLTTKVLFFQ